MICLPMLVNSVNQFDLPILIPNSPNFSIVIYFELVYIITIITIIIVDRYFYHAKRHDDGCT